MSALFLFFIYKYVCDFEIGITFGDSDLEIGI